MQDRRLDALAVMAVVTVLAGWLFSIRQVSTDWSASSSFPWLCAGLAVIALVCLICHERNHYTWNELGPVLPAIALNLLTHAAADQFVLPLHLDAVGTIVAGVMLGPYLGAATGIASSLLFALVNPTALAFVSIEAFIGMVSGILAQMGGFRNVFFAGISGLFVGIPCAILSAPLNLVAYGDLAGGLQIELVRQSLQEANLLGVILPNFIVLDLLANAVAFVLAWCVLTLGVVKPLWPRYFAPAANSRGA